MRQAAATMSTRWDRRRWVLFAAVLLMSAFSIMDMFEDVEEGTTAAHVLTEALITAVAISGAAFEGLAMLRRLREETAASAELRSRLQETQQEAERFKKDAGTFVAGLAAAIDAQLDHWGLTAAEKETALLLLKGLSHKEIADVREVGEATARQQARAIYKKAGLAGRHDLAAFFLEDLLAPAAAR